MADRLTTLENAIAVALIAINGSVQPSGYQYKTYTGQVDIEDDVIATAKNTSRLDINHTLTATFDEEANEEVNEEIGTGQNIYTNTVQYKIISQIKLSGDTGFSTKREAKKACNEVLSDLKYMIFEQRTLQNQCNYLDYVSSKPFFSSDGSLINSAKLETVIELNYSQSMRNPDLIAC